MNRSGSGGLRGSGSPWFSGQGENLLSGEVWRFGVVQEKPIIEVGRQGHGFTAMRSAAALANSKAATRFSERSEPSSGNSERLLLRISIVSHLSIS